MLATKTTDRTESSLEALQRYHDQLVLLEQKIPAQEVQIAFKWKDAFDKGSIFGGRMSLTVASIAYEKVSLCTFPPPLSTLPLLSLSLSTPPLLTSPRSVSCSTSGPSAPR